MEFTDFRQKPVVPPDDTVASLRINSCISIRYIIKHMTVVRHRQNVMPNCTILQM